MRAPRLSRLLAAVALCGMVAAAGWPSPGRPAGGGGGNGDHHIEITDLDFNDYDTVCYPYDLHTFYATIADDMEVAIDTPGMGGGGVAAPKAMGNKTHTLTFPADTTGVDITAHIQGKGGGASKDHDPRQGMNFLDCTGFKLAFKDLPRDARPPGAEPAEPAAKPGDPIPPGVHFAAFPPSDKIIPGSHARVWVQGKFKKGPLKPEYDLPAVLFWLPKGKVFYPCWVLTLPEKLAAGPLKKDGETPLTVMRPVLLDGKGKVQHIMTHRHWK